MMDEFITYGQLKQYLVTKSRGGFPQGAEVFAYDEKGRFFLGITVAKLFSMIPQEGITLDRLTEEINLYDNRRSFDVEGKPTGGLEMELPVEWIKGWLGERLVPRGFLDLNGEKPETYALTAKAMNARYTTNISIVDIVRMYAETGLF
jgi:hypothetical protein